ncbi:MAG: hypothetical protein N2438_11920, partial [Limisphaera sp.]|nr:hypothetical protein [Limisphaera sp.]
MHNKECQPRLRPRPPGPALWWLVLFWGATLSAGFAQHVPVVEVTLSNGMRMLLVERHDEPSIA